MRVKDTSCLLLNLFKNLVAKAKNWASSTAGRGAFCIHSFIAPNCCSLHNGVWKYNDEHGHAENLLSNVF